MRLGNALRFSDERDYWTIASHLTEQGMYSLDGLRPTAYRPPGYPLWLALLQRLGGGVQAARILNYILLAGTVLLLFALLRHVHSERAGAIAALLVCVYPVLFYTAGTLYPQTLIGFLLVAWVYLLFVNLNLPRAALAGILMGWLVLTAPTMLFVLAAAVPWLWKRPSGVWLLLTIFLCAGACVGVWTVRNYLAFGAFIPFSTNSGINLLLGNSPKATAWSGVNTDISAYAERARGLSEWQRDAFYRREAVRFIVENKDRAFMLYLHKLMHHFHFRNRLATRAESSPLRDWLMLVTYYPLLALALLRLALRRRYPLSPLEMYLLALYLLEAMIQAMFFTRIRFRLPFDLLLIAVDASFLNSLIKAYAPSRRGNL
ncbi:MAG: ArnT family glycosyltransferase [Armatimonadota bacterium]